jgi:outer membrane receptor protein involved in Fe transport
MAQEALLEEVIVTAQKRAENMQDVPISIQALETEQLEQLHINNFRDYVRMLPTVTMAPGNGAGPNAGPGFAAVYMRGVTTGGDGQAITSVPSVGMYLDEQPITTIQGNLDIHMYDIARVEALAGPQGTLYGMSSQAGTIRIITNKPDPTAFAAGYGLTGSMVDGDDTGYIAEGFVNLPIGEQAAIRLVGWYREDAGWVDNVPATRTFSANVTDDNGTPNNPNDDFPDLEDDITVSNADVVEENYNTVETYGARAALRVNLNDNWTIEPTFMIQNQYSEGSWGDDLNDFLASGDNAVAHFKEEYTDDEWYQAGITIEGKISNFDLTYSGNYLDREQEASFDYSDYSYFYDSIYYTGYFSGLFFDNNDERADGDPDNGNGVEGSLVPPVHRYYNNDKYTKQHHELRIMTPQDQRVRGLLGLFWQEQKHDFWQPFLVEGLADIMLPDQGANPLFADMVYLNSMDRTDTDEAVFGSVSFDITEKFELTGGLRFFKNESTVYGFFGFGLGFNRPCPPGVTEEDEDENIVCEPVIPPGEEGSDEPGAVANGGDGAYLPIGQGWSRNGEWRCPSQETVGDKPCINVDRKVKSDDYVGRITLNYKVTDDALLYATWSEGYRPGGFNRNPFVGDYESDFLTNWELGWKTEWGGSVQFNGAVFLEEWDNLQRAFQGSNGITQVDNAPSAEIIGTEMQVLWAVTDKFMLSAAAAYYNAELTSDYVEINSDGDEFVSAPDGSQLPITPEFKGNLIGRYEFPVGDFEAHLQGALTYEGSRPSEVVPKENKFKDGDIPSSTVLDLTAGIGRDSWRLEMFVMNATDEDAHVYVSQQCAIFSAGGADACGQQPYAIRRQPITFGLRFSQEF